jgi:peptidyl-prolyl cis-trans isomerase A (cyclophilin A)
MRYYSVFLMLLIIIIVAGCAAKTESQTAPANKEQKENQITPVGDDQTMSKLPNSIVILETSKGNIEIELDESKAPISSKNFLDYVNSGFYDGLIFHRVMDGFMIQGGGFDADMNEKETDEPIKNEAGNGLKNLRGTIAMARTNVIDSATSQFFINVVDNSFLDHVDDSQRGYGYAVFGKVIKGMDTVDKIKSVETGSVGGYTDVPVEPIIITKAYVKQ